MAIGDVYKVGLSFTNAAPGKGLSTGFHVLQAGSSGPSVAAIESDVYDWWSAAYTGGIAIRSLMDSSITLDKVTLRRINPLEALIQESTVFLPDAGTGAFDATVPQSSILLSLRTGNIGRSYRGRMFLPPAMESNTADSGALAESTAEQVAIQTAALFDEIRGVTNGYPIVVWSPTLGVGTEVTQVLCDRRLRTQRRRMPRGTVYKAASV